MKHKRSAVRRKRVIYRRMIKFIFASAAVIMLVSGFGAIRSFAGDRQNGRQTEDAYKYFTSVQVKDGDTLSSIARSHMSDEYSSVGDYIAEVASINHLDEDCHIVKGSHIIIPYYSVLEK